MPVTSNLSRFGLIFILLVVLIDSIGFGIILPVIPDLIISLTDLSLSEASRMGGWLMFTYALMRFFFAPVMGNLGDRFGRRPILLFALLALGLDYLLLAFVFYNCGDPLWANSARQSLNKQATRTLRYPHKIDRKFSDIGDRRVVFIVRWKYPFLALILKR